MKHFLILIAFLCFSKIHSQQVINIGSTKEEVEKVMGEPTSVKDYGTYGGIVWSFGNIGEATVTFKNNKVSEYNNYGGILKIGDIEEDRKRQKELNEKSKRLKEILGHDSNDTLVKENPTPEQIEQWKTNLLEAKKAVEEQRIKDGRKVGPFGTYSSQYSHGGYNWETYEGGKYKEVAEAENWSNFVAPENAERKLKDYNSRKLQKWLIIGGVLILLVGLLIVSATRKKKVNIDNGVNKNNVVKEAAKYGDDEMAPYEKKVAKIIFEIIQRINSDSNLIIAFGKSKFQEMVDKDFALEAFKYGMWRLNDKALADKYFQNPEYIKVNKDKFISDFNSKINSGYFNDFEQNDVNIYFLNWILKFRDDTIAINSFLNGQSN